MSDKPETPPPPDLVRMTADIVSAYVANNAVRAPELTAIIGSVHAALSAIVAHGSASEPEPAAPAVPIRKSVTPDFIISLEDGRSYKSLRRHLALHGLTPESYRAKWNLPFDYPMVAPNYTRLRSEIARSMRFGRKEQPETPPKARGRSKASENPPAGTTGRVPKRKAPESA